MARILGWAAIITLAAQGIGSERALGEAPEPPPDIQAAERSYRAGQTLVKSREFEKGIRELENAYAIVPYPVYLFSIAASYERWGLPAKCAPALQAWNRFFAACDRCKDEERARRRRAKAEEQCRSELTIRTVPSGAEVELDGSRRGSTPLTLKVPGGEHALHVAYSGFKDLARTLTTEYGVATALELSLEAVPPEPPKAPVPAAGGPKVGPDIAASPPAADGSTLRTLGWISGAAGLAGAAAGAIFGFKLLSDNREHDRLVRQGNVSSDGTRVRELESDASGDRGFAYAGWSVALLGALGAAACFVLAPREGAAEAAIALQEGASGLGLRARF